MLYSNRKENYYGVEKKLRYVDRHVIAYKSIKIIRQRGSEVENAQQGNPLGWNRLYSFYYISTCLNDL